MEKSMQETWGVNPAAWSCEMSVWKKELQWCSPADQEIPTVVTHWDVGFIITSTCSSLHSAEVWGALTSIRVSTVWTRQFSLHCRHKYASEVSPLTLRESGVPCLAPYSDAPTALVWYIPSLIKQFATKIILRDCGNYYMCAYGQASLVSYFI